MAILFPARYAAKSLQKLLIPFEYLR